MSPSPVTVDAGTSQVEQSMRLYVWIEYRKRRGKAQPEICPVMAINPALADTERRISQVIAVDVPLLLTMGAGRPAEAAKQLEVT